MENQPRKEERKFHNNRKARRDRKKCRDGARHEGEMIPLEEVRSQEDAMTKEETNLREMCNGEKSIREEADPGEGESQEEVSHEDAKNHGDMTPSPIAEEAQETKMVKVVGIRFKKAGKIYYFDPGDLELQSGIGVIVETARGIEYGDVVVGIKFVSEDEVVAPLRRVISIATEEDKLKVAENERKARDAFEICQRKIGEHKLPMKLIDVEYTFDNSKIIFYFTADGRIDFRELVRDLASIFKTRIELRQIGVRDEAKMLGGLGCCGRSLCCATFLGDFEPVSIKMAKDQNLSLNPTKISGICGRLMCCLKYESDTYKEVKSELPKVGSKIRYEDGISIVVEQDLLNESVKVELEDGTITDIPSEEIDEYDGS